MSPMAIFIEMIINHTSHLRYPSVTRNMVNAKLVLDHIAAVAEKDPATLTRIISGVRLSRSQSQTYFPKPRGTAAERQIASIVTQTCPGLADCGNRGVKVQRHKRQGLPTKLGGCGHPTRGGCACGIYSTNGGRGRQRRGRSAATQRRETW